MAEAPAVNDTLTPDDAVDVMEELLPAQNKSYELGLKFKLPHHDVESIHSVYSKPRSRLLHILIGFTSQTEPRPTWRVIIEALRSPAVDEPALARRVEAAHFPDPTATRDVVAAFQKNQASPPLQGGVRMMQRHQALAAGQGQALLFNEMLFKIAQSLSARDVESLTYTLCNSLLGMSADRVSSVTQLFQLLQQRQIVTPTNLQALYNELENIGRSDLSKLINNYLIEIGRPPCQPGRDEGGGAINGGLPPVSTQTIAPTEEIRYPQLTSAPPPPQQAQLPTSLYHQHHHYLQQRQIVTPTNLQALYNELENIGRSDLSKLINNYLIEIGRPPCKPGRDEDGGAINGGLPPVSTQILAEEIRYPQLMMTSAPPPPQQAQPPASHCHQHHHQAYGVTEGGQQISSPSDTTWPTLTSGNYSTGLTSSQPSFPSTESSAMDLESMRSKISEHDHHTQHQQVSFPPSQIYPISSRSGFSVEETRGQDFPLQSQPLALLFDANEDEKERKQEGREKGIVLEMSRMELQDLQKQLTQTQELLMAKEQERKRLQEQLHNLQQLTAKIMEEKQDQSVQYETSKHELKSALQVKIEEIDLLRQQVQGLQQAPRQIPEMHPEEFYPLNKNPHGVCFIINNCRFYHETNPTMAHPDLRGADIDQYNLTQTFRYLRYKVEVCQNLTADQMTDALLRMSQRDHSGYDSFVCCILSHGEHNIIYGADSEPLNIDDLTGVMKLCRSLRNKPKLFFIQCCRGEAEEVGFEKDNPGDSTFHSTIPRDADFFLGYATPLGKAAYRSQKHGSWYISELCRVFTQYGYHNSFSSMMRRVNLQVSGAFTKDGYKQCPEFVDRLQMDVHFFHFIRNAAQ